MVDDQIDDDADAPLLASMRELHKVTKRAVARINAVIIRDIVPIVAKRRRLKRHQPDRGYPDALQIVQPVHQPAEISDPVAIRIHERRDREAIDNRVLVPKIVDHARAPLSSRFRNALIQNLLRGAAALGLFRSIFFVTTETTVTSRVPHPWVLRVPVLTFPCESPREPPAIYCSGRIPKWALKCFTSTSSAPLPSTSRMMNHAFWDQPVAALRLFGGRGLE